MAPKLKFAILLSAIAFLCGFVKSFPALSPDKLQDLVNADRKSKGLPTLQLNTNLNLAAFEHAQDMIIHNYFAHNSPAGIQPWEWIQKSGYSYAYAGENLAVGYSDAADLENSWMNSPSHRANILSPYFEDMGLAVIKSHDSTLVVQIFGSERQLTKK